MRTATAVLIVSHDLVGAKMAGPGIRYWELARALSRHLQVTLAVPGEASVSTTEFRVLPFSPHEWDSLKNAAERADTILLCGDVLAWFPDLQQLGTPLIVDGYDPHTLETLALFAGSPQQEQRHQERQRIQRLQCQVGDFFICASERQRDWWLGLLEAAGRVNADTYGEDPSLRKLIDVVPFGLPSDPPRHTRHVLKGVWPGIKPDDKVVLWGGGLWQWLDPLTAVRAMALIRKERNDVKLVFPGTRHPNAGVPGMPVVRQATALSDELGLLDECVFFGDWVDYEEWPNYLLESDVGLSLHRDTVETRLAFRSRILDYVWAGLPMVVTQGDVTSGLVVRYGLGEVIGFGEVHDLTAALLQLLENPAPIAEARFEEARAELTWERAAEPLVAFCRTPYLAADRVDDGKQDGSAATLNRQPAGGLESLERRVANQEAEISRLRERLAGYEQGRFIRLMKWLHNVRPMRGDGC
ncbi:MAG: glycosyltransferase [Anaerolineae bacterium]